MIRPYVIWIAMKPEIQRVCRYSKVAIVESARSIPYGEHKIARNYVLSAHYIALIRAI
jgi:hypothetical protein